jgi:hypothetical protein
MQVRLVLVLVLVPARLLPEPVLVAALLPLVLVLVLVQALVRQLPASAVVPAALLWASPADVALAWPARVSPHAGQVHP